MGRAGGGMGGRRERGKRNGLCLCVCHSGIPHANQPEDIQMAEEQVEEIGSLKQKQKKKKKTVRQTA